MITIGIDQSTMRAVSKKLGGLTPMLSRAIDLAITKAAFTIEGEAKSRTPVDTGRLRSSIETRLMPMQATVTPTASYATFVHDGTRYIKGRPFMTDAVRAKKNDIAEIFKNEIDAVINQEFNT